MGPIKSSVLAYLYASREYLVQQTASSSRIILLQTFSPKYWAEKGFVNGFGAFQTYYNDHLPQSPSTISWIGSTQAFLLLTVGVFAGGAFDAGYFREMLYSGSVLVVLGIMMTSIAKTYTHIILAQGICVGVGQGLLFVPSVAILPQYFSTRKALANGLAATGSSVGGIIYPIVFRQLVASRGFGWATRAIGFISLGTLSVAVVFMRCRIIPASKRQLLDLSAFKEMPYTFFCLAMFFGFIGLYGPIFYLPSYATSKNIMDANLAAYLVPILNAASIFGRIIPNTLADYIGPQNVLIPATLSTGILALCWIGVKNSAGLFVFAALYGFTSGGFVSLPPPTLVGLSPSVKVLGTRMGMCFGISSLGLLIGTPLSGQILSRTHSYVGVQIFSGVTIFVTGLLALASRFAKVGAKLKVKV